MFSMYKPWRIRRSEQAYDTDDGTITPEALLGVMEHQEFLCAICGEIPDGYPSPDHIIPLSRGGAHSITNIQITCWPCNWRKWNRYPYEIYRPGYRTWDKINHDISDEW